MSALNRQEHRALRAIEKSMKAEDPELAEQLRSFGGDAVRRLHRYAGWAAGPLVLLGIAVGDAVPLLTGVLLATWAVLGWTARPVS
ncbi:DUF3040 domain-containing protein [Amycolatopsis balhimycina DSM 5908]|uniref:DUF3040 domain-containing protein n=1 Tax=Amycolatopsis balhimycina DSM 5908 TaxID=1081091 RepID=A0A428WP17_AMYBA|nr:DUF3040 domain-containing protein [Amycolatopsis balhimycina]RSM44821.1 DUF3040 domain-containing protein [Amycolatopsis balhimycina DSM 5908]